MALVPFSLPSFFVAPGVTSSLALVASSSLRRVWTALMIFEAILERESAGRCGARVACFLFFSFLSETRVKKEKRFELESGRRRKKSKRALACLLRRF